MSFFKDPATYTTTAETYQTVASMTLSGLRTGNYVLMFVFIYHNSIDEGLVNVRAQNDGTTTVFEKSLLSVIPANIEQYTVYEQYYFDGDDHTITVDYCTGTTGTTATISEVSILCTPIV